MALMIGAMAAAPLSVLAQTPAARSTAVSESKDPSARVNYLHRQATALMDAGNFATACPKLEEALRLAPEAAIGTRINLAYCYSKSERLALAYTHYSTAATLARRVGTDERLQAAHDGMKRLQASVGILKVDVAEELFSLPGLVITLDGAPMPELAWVRTIGLNPGAHTIEISAPGRVTRRVHVEGPDQGKVGTANIPMLDPVNSDPEPGRSAPPPPASAPEARAPLKGQTVHAPASRSSLPGFVGLGAAGAAVVAGGVLVGLAVGVPGEINSQLPKDASGNSQCFRAPRPGEAAVCADLRAKAESGSMMGNVGVGLVVGGGVVAVASIVYLLLTPPKAAAGGKAGTLVPVVGQTGGGLVWAGSF